MTDRQTEKFLKDVEGIRVALQQISKGLAQVIDPKKKHLRMVDTERGKVYQSHLGKKLQR